MKAGYYGVTISPPELDDLFTSKGIFVQLDLLNDNALQAIYPTIAFQGVHSFVQVPADMGLLKSLSDDDTLTISLELDFDHNPNDGIQTHFVEVKSYDGTTLMIYDPWDGTEKNFTDSYGNTPAVTIQKFVVYKGTPVDNNDPLVCDKKSVRDMLVGKASNFDGVFNYLQSVYNLPEPMRLTYDNGEILIDRIKQIQTAYILRKSANDKQAVISIQTESATPQIVTVTPPVSVVPVVPSNTVAPNVPSIQPIPFYNQDLGELIRNFFVALFRKH